MTVRNRRSGNEAILVADPQKPEELFGAGNFWVYVERKDKNGKLVRTYWDLCNIELVNK